MEDEVSEGGRSDRNDGHGDSDLLPKSRFFLDGRVLTQHLFLLSFLR